MQLLPFGDLAWENFERLCLALARTEGEPERVQLFGTRGQDQSGIDIFSRTGERYVVYQCRRVEALTEAGIRRAVADFLAGEWAARATRFVLCTSFSVVATVLANAIESQAAELRERVPPVAFEVRDAEELSAKLKLEEGIVLDFFGRAWLEAFLPNTARIETSAQLAAVHEDVQAIRQHLRPRVIVVDEGPSAIREALRRLAAEDAELVVRLEDNLGNPPDPARAVAVINVPPRWIEGTGPAIWCVLALTAERAGEWDAAQRAWAAAAERADGDARADLLVAGSAAADIGRDRARADELLRAASHIAPEHPRVLLQQIDQSLGGEERRQRLEPIESADPRIQALISTHKALAHLLLADMDAARQAVDDAERLAAESLTVRSLRVNLVVQQARVNSLAHGPIDYPALNDAYSQALVLREELLAQRRYEESMRVLMLASDALVLSQEHRSARALLGRATPQEREAPEAGDVLGDAALRCGGWQLALELTEGAADTDAIARIRACAHLEGGNLSAQNAALETLDRIVASRGPEAPHAALFRLAATFGRRRPGWSNEAESVLREAGQEAAATTAQALFLAVQQHDVDGARALLEPHAGETWAQMVALRVVTIRAGNAQAVREIASALLTAGVAADDRVLCGQALALVGESDRARDVLLLTARDPGAPPAVRADAYNAVVRILADANDWGTAATVHAEWTEVRAEDERASAWAPRIANRIAQR